MRPELMSVTPTMATEWLTRTKVRNRKIDENRVNEWLSEMKAGNWMPGPPLAMDTFGNVIDGQHRLMAVIEYGEPVEFWVMFDAPKHMQQVIDDGKSRSFADILEMAEVPQAATKAGVVTMLAYYDNFIQRGPDSRGISPFRDTQGRRMNRHAQLAAWNRYRDEIEGAMIFGSRVAAQSQLGLTVRIATTLSVILRRLDPILTEEFFQHLIDGTVLGKDHPIYMLREQLLKNALGRHKRAVQSMNLSYKAALIFKTWNYWLEGRRPRILSWKAAGKAAEDFPLPRKQL